MSEKHTPGPWEATPNMETWIQTVGDPYGHGSMHIADVRGWGHLTGHGGGCAFSETKAIAIQEANARLIAAAPSLFLACHAADTMLLLLACRDESEEIARRETRALLAAALAMTNPSGE